MGIELDKNRVKKIIRAALKEDLGRGDITTNFIIPKLESVNGVIFANEECVLCGISIAEWIFSEMDFSVRFKPQAEDGEALHPGQEAAFVEGHARAILTAERVALNFLSFLSGIATETRKYVDKAGDRACRVLDTRKTFPLLRYLEKYAVQVGGGHNHRMDLGEMVMVK
ncbi:MAG: nicotinate-nucleotide diphosphorylase (carboxylating), partial [Candidatus Omnitrophota bacterium]